MNLIFDLDGTLTNPELGITRCIAYALEQLGCPVPDQAVLRRYIGPPLQEVFGTLLATSDPALIGHAVSLYRTRFGYTGLYENELYPDTAETLDRLSAAGHRLFVATAKAEVYARRIIEYFDIRAQFMEVYGAALSGERSHKAELLAHLVAEQRIAPAESVMIGDRGGDVAGARANGMRSVGVLWGYGSMEELAGANHLVRTWTELVAWMDG